MCIGPHGVHRSSPLLVVLRRYANRKDSYRSWKESKLSEDPSWTLDAEMKKRRDPTYVPPAKVTDDSFGEVRTARCGFNMKGIRSLTVDVIRSCRDHSWKLRRLLLETGVKLIRAVDELQCVTLAKLKTLGLGGGLGSNMTSRWVRMTAHCLRNRYDLLM